MSAWSKLNDWLKETGTRTVFGESEAIPSASIQSGQAVPAEQRQVAATSTISVRDCRESPPEFEREYTCRLTRDVSVTITMETFFDREASGILNQSDGRWVLFDPDQVADEILDPAILPKVEMVCRTVAEMDRQFMRTRADEFTDENGARWKRLP